MEEKRNKKILYVASSGIHILDFHLPYLKALKEAGCSLHVLVGDGDFDCPYADEVLWIPMQKRLTSPVNLRAITRVRGLLEREGYDLISCHTELASCITRQAVRGMKTKRPVVFNTSHGYLFDDRTAPLRRLVFRRIEEHLRDQTDLLFVMNREDWDLAAKYSLCRGEVGRICGMGFPDRPVQKREKREGFTLLCAAEFSGRKNQQMLLEMMKYLPKEVGLKLPGQGKTLEKLKRKAKKLGLTDRVDFPGYCGDLTEYLAQADCVVSASRYEGCPFQIMEALAWGIPVIATDVKGNRDLILGSSNGALVAFDDARQMAAEVGKLMTGRASYHATLDEAYRLDRVLPTVMESYKKYLNL